MDPRDAERSLKAINNAIHEVYSHKPTTRSIHDLCSKASRLVQNKFGQKLYSGIVSTMASHLKQMTTSIEKVSPDVPLFLEELIKKWMEHDKAFQILRPVFMCMDGTCSPSTHKAHAQELGATLWVDNVICSSNIKGDLKFAVMEMVQAEREGEGINRDLMKNLAKMLMDFGHSVYQEMFEQPFIMISTNLYTPESEELMNNYDCEYYLKITERRLNEEIERVSDYLDVKHDFAAKSIAKIINVLENIMIETHMDTLVRSGLVRMIEHDKYDDLARMYNLFRRVPEGINKIFNVMNSHFGKTVTELATHPERIEDPIDCVQNILDEKEKRDKIINLSFNDDLKIQKLMDHWFKGCINAPHVAEFISEFVDDKLRKGANGYDVEIVLNKVMVLIRLLFPGRKVLFESHYKQHMRERFLSGIGRYVPAYAEISMIEKLKKEFSHQFTSELEAMLSDAKKGIITHG
ncbi:Cullin [Artemisia annua]|uniref:Cullin n=1 Tax=Artemisia annua TaxID=35608 RepID=A0A2U1L9R8_ARTAN|nr:Cullin [Artemisia annua]